MENNYSRREALGLGLGAAAFGALSLANSAAAKESASGGNKPETVTPSDEYHKYGEDLERILLLRSFPVAIKMLEKEEDIPKDAIRPKNKGYHLAQCQAIAMSRREGATLAMLKQDHWCPTAVMAYGLAPKPESVDNWSHPYDSFEYGKYIGIVSAPLKSASFLPDVVIIYVNPAQLRGLLLTMPISKVSEVNYHFFPPSCGYSVVNPMKTGKYWVVLPDPGEYQRALTQEGDLIFTVPGARMPEMMKDLRRNEHGPFSYRDHQMFMQTDFPLPEFYRQMFKEWGMDTE